MLAGPSLASSKRPAISQPALMISFPPSLGGACGERRWPSDRAEVQPGEAPFGAVVGGDLGRAKFVVGVLVGRQAIERGHVVVAAATVAGPQ